MAFVHGRATAFYANGVDLTGQFRKISKKPLVGVVESTCFGKSSKEFLPSLYDATWSADGLFDASLLVGSDTVLYPLLGAASSVLCTEFIGGDSFGAYGYAWRSKNTQHELASPVNDLVPLMVGGQVDDDFERVRSIHALGAETSGSNSTSLDNSAGTTAGASAYLHAPAFTGTTITVKVQHSTNNSSWSDLITFTAVTGARTSERKAVTGTINRYVRTLWSGTFTSATFAVAFSRF